MRLGADQPDGTAAIHLADSVDGRIGGHAASYDQVLVVSHGPVPPNMPRSLRIRLAHASDRPSTRAKGSRRCSPCNEVRSAWDVRRSKIRVLWRELGAGRLSGGHERRGKLST